MRFLLLLIGLVLTLPVQADWVPKHRPVPGGVAVIDLGSASEKRPRQITYNDRPVMLRVSNDRWKALVGLALDADVGGHHIMADGRRLAFQVQHQGYDEQHITLRNERHVNPNQEDLDRIGRELQRIRAALATWSHSEPDSLRMPLPVEGRFSSPFGLQRFFNDQPRRPHNGLDIANDTGTPIQSPATATVVDAGDFFFNGKTVFLDHGQGLITMYCHMDRIDVAPGDTVILGQSLGTVGATGRVTGPHLHWSVFLNGNAIDPALFLAEGDA
ncbi:MAG: peptidoglycan DD-metalloendopeptidase family protein [Aquisalimonadaceae bacterium]